MRALAFLLVLAAATTAWARPRVQVAPFGVRDETVGYFGPEVARAVAAALEGAGVETGAGAEATLSGHVELLPGDRVRLTAVLHGRTLLAEGPLEAIDAVATQLANQVAPLLLENDPAGQRAAEKRARDAARRAAAVPPSPPPGERAPAPSSPPPAPANAPPAEPKSPSSASEPEAPAHPSETAEPSEPSAPADGKAKPPLAADGKAKPPLAADGKAKLPLADAKPDAPRPVEPPKVAAAEPARAAAAAPAPPPYFAGYVRGRVVAHAVTDPQSAYPGAGNTATQALFAFLQRRLRLAVIPTGVGITSAAVAADEGYRAGARGVVMARLDRVDYLPGPMVRCRLEVVVVRDGRPVMRRVVEAAPTVATRRGDPLFSAVTVGLEALVPELVGALIDVR